jgi:tRNA modification GTPase
MRPSSDHTIFAPASGQGRAAICVIRLSGPGTRSVLERIAGTVPEPRRLALRTLRDPDSAEPLDQALVTWIPGPGSFTGEDQAELHIHGGLASRAAVLRVLSSLDGVRPAGPGEFTRRAFLNGRMDLSRAEGLADLIDAETEAQRRQAFRQLEGKLGRAIETWREALLQALAVLEAAIDFSDEGDVPEALEMEAAGQLREVRDGIGAALAGRGGERLREGFTVVIAGRPNAGKSTLLNALARRDVAIVSPFAGTTRDLIEVHLDLEGLPVIVVDTAGLRESDDPIEREGVSRARARAQAADLVLWLIPPEGAGEPPPQGVETLKIATKADLGVPPADSDFLVSAATGQGIPDLLTRIAERARSMVGQGDAVITRERHRGALKRAHAALDRAMELLQGGQAVELAAEEVRVATWAVGEVTGRVDVEDVLDRLFSSFCIGK